MCRWRTVTCKTLLTHLLKAPTDGDNSSNYDDNNSKNGNE